MKIVINNVQTVVQVGGKDFLIDPDLMQRFREYLSIKVPGSFFAAKKLRFHWDGMKYFITPGGKMATGFLPVFLKYVEEVYPDLEVEIIDDRGQLPSFKREFIEKIGDLAAYEHQKELILALKHDISFRGQLIPFYRGVVDASTNSGKSLVIAGLFLNLTGSHKMIVIIHRKTIYRELLSFLQSVFGEVGEINDQHYFIGKEVTIAMIQTLSSRIEDLNVKKDLGLFTILACDEIHAGGSKMYSSTLVHCNASVRLGTSGTSFDSNDVISKMIIVGLFGPKLVCISKREMMDEGISTPVTVYMHLVNTILRAPVLDYRESVKILIHESVERAAIITRLVKEKSKLGCVLVSVAKTQHGIFLQNYLTSQGIESELTHSKDKNIIAKVDAFRDGHIDCLISTGTLREGVNLPRIKTIIFAEGLMSKISVKQWMGRGERKFEGKEEVEFHDFYDVGKFCSTYSMKRLKMYRDENLPVVLDFPEKDLRKMKSIVIV